MWFLTYSMMGWLVESIYMSFCNHKITNRGFEKVRFARSTGLVLLRCFLYYVRIATIVYCCFSWDRFLQRRWNF